MSDYNSILAAIAASYRHPRTIDDVKRSFERKLRDKYSIRFIEPQFDIKLVTKPEKHPFGGLMENWSRFPAFEDLDYSDLASQVIDAGKASFLPRVSLSTIPTLRMRMYVNTMADPYLLPYIKRHEYNHMLAHSLPFNLTYIYGLKKYNQMKSEGYFRPDNEMYSNWKLTQSMQDWVNGYRKSTGFECLLGSNNFRETRFDKMTRYVKDFDARLDSLENGNNINYTNAFEEDELLNYYGCFIRDMEDLP